MSQKQTIKAKLKIVLKANDLVIAESSDPILWQSVLAAINAPQDDSSGTDLGNYNQQNENKFLLQKEPIDKLANEIGVTVNIIRGSCSPSDIAPFIHLDKHHWEAMKKATPARGSKAISPTALASTLLILWKEQAKLGDCSVKEAQEILKTIGLHDSHATRSLNNCEWLQQRGKKIIINPAQTSKAIELAKAYCTKEWPKQ